MAEQAPRAVVHPKVKAAAKVAAVLVALDGLVVALIGAVPSPAVLSVLVTLHAVLPIIAGYLKTA